MNIAGIEIGGSAPCRFVAEISNNHNGDRDRCGRLIDAAQEAGADFVKFQCYTPDELVALRGDRPAPEPWGSQGWSMRDLYTKAQTPHDWFPKIKAHCERVGVPWFSSVFGEESLALLESLDCPAYKIARLDNGNTPLVHAAYYTRKPLVVSLGPEDGIEPNAALKLWCPEGYPQADFSLWGRFEAPMSDLDEAVIGPGDYDGFSYHGTSIEPPIVAATLGAKIIEAHFQLDDEPSELEANVSLTASQFAEMIRRVRDVEAMLA